MRINLSRRRIKAFIAKWGGLVLAAILIVPITAIGGTFLYANSRVDNTTNWVTQAITMTDFEAVELPSETATAIAYRIVISIDNSTPDAAQIIISDAKLTFFDAANARLPVNGASFNLVGSADWQGRIIGKSILAFEGYIDIGHDDAQALWDKPLILRITGNATAKARHAFVEKEETRPLNISTEVTIPYPSVTQDDFADAQ